MCELVPEITRAMKASRYSNKKFHVILRNVLASKRDWNARPSVTTPFAIRLVEAVYEGGSNSLAFEHLNAILFELGEVAGPHPMFRRVQDELVRASLRKLADTLRGMHSAGILAETDRFSKSAVLADVLTQNFDAILSPHFRREYITILKELLKFSPSVFGTRKPWHKELLFVQEDLNFIEADQVAMSEFF